MQSTWYSLLNFIPTFVMVVFLIAAMIFVATKPNDGTSAKLLALIALGIMLFLEATSIAFNFFVARAIDVDLMGLYYGVYSILSTSFHLAALSLFIAAVFTGRQRRAESHDPSSERLPSQSSNPYTPPVN